MRQAIAMMAKAPVAGEVKTRLCPPLSRRDAAALYRCFLLDSIAKISQIEAATPVLSYAPATAQTVFETLAPGWTLLPQQGCDLGARMADCFAQLFAREYTGVLLTGSDLPTLPAEVFHQALALLNTPKTDVVLGPSEDGGYYLIGLRTLYSAVFDDMIWSTPQVFTDTVQRAERLGLNVALLPRWYDIDTPADLIRLRGTALQDPTGSLRHTQHFFATHPSIGTDGA
jgi:rSAM/selenodomain-associated transferase 1